MTPHIHIDDARAAIDAVNNELTTWINRARDAEQRETDLLQSWAEADKARQAAECAHAQLAEEFSDLATNAQWMADIIQSHLPHLPEAREALDASPGVSAARMKAKWQTEALEEIVSVFADPDSESALDVVEYAAELAALKRRQATGGD